MHALLNAANGTSLPMDAVGWAVTGLGLAFVVAWTVYLYR